MPPPIRFTLTEDEVSIAYSVHGSGPPLVFVRGWISHLDLQWLFPDYRIFMEALGRHFTVIRYDMRGNGLSERNVLGRLTLDDLALDLLALTEALDLGDDATYLATCYGAAILARYAWVSNAPMGRVILDNAYARGEDVATPQTRESVLSAVRLLESSPGAAATLLRYYTDPNDTSSASTARERVMHFGSDSIDPAVAEELYSLAFSFDISKELLNLNAPTLVTHRRESKAVAVELGRKVAALVPGAAFAAQNGRSTNPWDGDATDVLNAIGEFVSAPLTLGYYPRTTVRPTVVLFSDMVDSTETTAALGDTAAHEIIRAFHSISRECLEARGGRLVKSMGDGLMAEFPSVSQALGCAVDMQTTFATQLLMVRIGINAGEPVSEDDDLHGLVVSTADRICDQGLGGEILVSNVVRELAMGKGFAFVDRGSAQLKGLREPVHLFRVDYEAAL